MKFILDPRLKDFRTGVLKVHKDDQNVIGISVAGGSPHCPVLYVVQVFDNSPVYNCGILEPGDEIVRVNGVSCHGWAKQDLSKFIKSCDGQLTIEYKKFECSLEEGRSADIVYKILKHRFIENLSAQTADDLGLSRAILSNDQLALKVQQLNKLASSLKEIRAQFNKYNSQLNILTEVLKCIGDNLAEIAVHENSGTAFKSFNEIADSHRSMAKSTGDLLQNLIPISDKLGTFLTVAIPDTKKTLQKYLQAKFEYLSHCLKTREIEDEDGDVSFDECVLERLASGNYDYRLQLKCRHLTKIKFAKAKNDMLQKLELLDQKNVFQIVEILQQFSKYSSAFFGNCLEYTQDRSIKIELSESFHNF